jgi:hypothetical protein
MLRLRHSIRTGVASDVRDATKTTWALEYDDRNRLVESISAASLGGIRNSGFQ